MDIGGLEYFIKAAETRNFTQAARQCSITQTAMSQHIHNMESSLGFRLFDRNTRQVQLTPAGEEFYKEAKQILEQYGSAVNKSRRIADGENGGLVLALPGYPEGRLLMPRLQQFQAEYPDIKLHTKVCYPVEMPSMLQKKECDAAIFLPHDFDKQDADAVLLGKFKLDLMCSPAGPMAGKKEVELAELQQLHLLSVNLSSMPHTLHSIEKQWHECGAIMPEPSPEDNIRSLEEAELQITLDQNAGILVPCYVRSFVTDHMLFIPLKDELMFSLYVIVARNSEKTGMSALSATLLDNRLPLTY